MERTLPVRRVDDASGNHIGYFGCRFFERSQVERDDFDADATCPKAEPGPSSPQPWSGCGGTTP